MYYIQYIIISLVLLAALSYVCRRIYFILKHSNNKCYGCNGCEVRNQLLKNKRKAHKQGTACKLD